MSAFQVLHLYIYSLRRKSLCEIVLFHLQFSAKQETFSWKSQREARNRERRRSKFSYQITSATIASDSEPEDAEFIPNSSEEEEGESEILIPISPLETVHDRQLFHWCLNRKTMNNALQFRGISDIDDIYQYPINHLFTFSDPINNFDPNAMCFFQPEYPDAAGNNCPGQYWTTSLIMIIRDGEQVLGYKKIMAYNEDNSPGSKWLMEEYIVEQDNFPRVLGPGEKVNISRPFFLNRLRRP